MGWDKEWLALDGALAGIMVGSTYQLGHAYFALPGETTPATHSVAVIAAASITGTLIGAAIKVIMKRLQSRS
jgi:predicted membrane-bound spermidine synthase